MHQPNLDRFRDFLRARSLSAALLANPATITWLTGYAPPIQTGPSPFDGGPALGWFCGGELVLILSDMEAPAARATGAQVIEYAGYTVEQPLACTERQIQALREALEPHSGLSGKAAVEWSALPAVMLGPIQEALPRVEWQAHDRSLDGMRAIKTADELAKIRAALRLCDLAQADVKAHLRPGVSELELWGGMKARLEIEAGGRLPLLADLAGGLRTAEIGGLPGAYTLREGDPLIFDVVPRLDGYWGDNAATHFAGQPPDALVGLYGIVRDALQRGIDAVRPGARARDLDQLLRSTIRDAGYEPHPHHSGHGIGVTYHEEPRIVPYNDMPLEVGMVIAIEPGIYVPGTGGVRLEHAVLVAPGGCEVLTRHLD